MDPRITVAVIDDPSIRELGKVPWPRSIHAKLVEELMKFDPALVAFDVLFTEPDTRYKEEDQALIAATRKYKNKIIHCLFESIEASSNQGGLSLPRVTVLRPFEGLFEASKHVGFVDDQKIEGNQIIHTKDADGGRRRTLLSKQTADGENVLSLGAEAFAVLNNLSTDEFIKKYPNQSQLNYAGVHRVYTEGGKVIETEPYLQISISDIIQRKLKPETKERLKGAIVFVASVATGYYDHHPTPYSAMSPGISIHVYALNGLLQNNNLSVFPRLGIIFLMIVMGFGMAIALERFSAMANTVLLGAILAGLWGTSLLLFVYKNLIVDALTPSVSTLIIFATATLYRIAVEEKEKRWIKNTFGQYLSPKVVSLLVENPEALKLGGEKRLMTVLFLDIAHFTTMSEKLSPEELTKVLNHYLTIFTDIVMKHDGVVDKFIGDCVMAFWNAPFDQSQHPVQACLAALEMSQKTKETQIEGIPQVEVRIGVHTGYMVVGNMGSQARFNYTVVGDNVNFASRLEGANKYFKSNILISEATYEVCKDKIIVREIGKIRVVGKENPVGIFEVLGQANGENPHAESLKIWKSALYALSKGVVPEAKRQLEHYLRLHPEDPAALNYLKMLDKGISQDFVINLTEK